MIRTIFLLCVAVTLSIAASAPGQTTPPSTQPASGAKELAVDDGTSAGKMSVAGGGHAIAFDAPGGGFVLAGVRVYGSRYGTTEAPAENFQVYLLSADGKKTLKVFALPYKTFQRGEPKWVLLKTDPTPLPQRFIICLGFNPERTKGVYVHYDAKLDGDSRIGLPGSLNEPAKGDWMIRAVVRPAKGE